MPTDGGDTSALDMVARYLAEAVNTKDKASAAFLACNTPSGGEARRAIEQVIDDGYHLTRENGGYASVIHGVVHYRMDKRDLTSNISARIVWGDGTACVSLVQ